MQIENIATCKMKYEIEQYIKRVQHEKKVQHEKITT